jgi:predicted lipoprotein with Yx(FWY)xxD motif
MGRPTLFLVALLGLVAVVAGCGSTGAVPRVGGSGLRGEQVILSTEQIPDLGTVLVDEGVTLYVFAPDHATEVTCKGPCASAWPPLTVAAGQEPTATGAVRANLIGTDPGAHGSKVVTYAGWPLYSFVSDTEPGEANGQNVELNGGYWYVISPSGKIIR